MYCKHKDSLDHASVAQLCQSSCSVVFRLPHILCFASVLVEAVMTDGCNNLAGFKLQGRHSHFCMTHACCVCAESGHTEVTVQNGSRHHAAGQHHCVRRAVALRGSQRGRCNIGPAPCSLPAQQAGLAHAGLCPPLLPFTILHTLNTCCNL